MDQNPPKESRPPINLRIKFRSESVEQFIERYAVDVSRGGIFIRTREPLAVGTQLKLDFQFQNGTPLMAGDGTVVWIREFDANRTTVPPGMGVRFDKLTPESQAVLEQLLAEKAKRERSGIPGSGSHGAGGIAVRRPSSTFSALESQATGSGPQSSGAAPATAAGSGPTRSATPLSPLAAVTSQVSSSALKGEASGSTLGIGAGEPTKKTETSAYRPLGKARNPFSSVGGQDASENPASTSTSTSTSTSDDDDNDSGAPFGDINDEPTQIAGRLPSFLLSDDDATVANAQIPTKVAEAKAGPEKSAQESAQQSANARRDSAALPRSPLPGMGRSEQSAAKPGKDAASDKDRKKKDRTSEDVKSETAGEPRRGSAQHAKVEATSDAAVAAAPAGISDAATAAAAPSKPAEAVAAKTAEAQTTGTTAGTTTDKASDKAKSAKSPRQARRSGAALVAATAIVLGGGGLFLYGFFTSHSTQTGPSLASGGPSTAGPPPAAVPAEVPAAPGNGAAEPTPPGTAQTGDSTGSGANPAVATGTPAGGPPPPSQGAAAPTEAARPDEGAPASAADESNRKPSKHKSTRGAREAAEAAAAQPDKAGPSGTVPAASSTAPATPPNTAKATAKTAEQSAPAAEADGPSHQIRVTSKPDGADVTLDGQTVGKTPFTVGIADVNAPHFIAVRKDGFEPFEQMISSTSPWSKAKTSKDKTALQVLKINAKLKAIAGAEARPTTEPGSVGTADSAARAAAPKTAPPAKAAPGPDSPLAPADERAAPTDNKP